MTGYIFRFDDLSRFSDLDKWKRVLEPFNDDCLPALVAVIPDCKDEKLMKREPVTEPVFWEFVKSLKKFDVGMHGLHHENFQFMGCEQQGAWMADSMKLFVKNRVIPNVFVAPNHGVNRYTLPAMKSVGLEFLSEGIGLYPWKDENTDIMVVPQIFWTPRLMPLGVVTFCLHPDTISKKEIEYVKKFVDDNEYDVMSICDAEPCPLSVLNVPFELVYKYFYKKNKNLKKR